MRLISIYLRQDEVPGCRNILIDNLYQVKDIQDEIDRSAEKEECREDGWS